MTCSELLITGENGGNIKPRSIMQIIPPDTKSLIKSFFCMYVCYNIIFLQVTGKQNYSRPCWMT